MNFEEWQALSKRYNELSDEEKEEIAKMATVTMDDEGNPVPKEDRDVPADITVDEALRRLGKSNLIEDKKEKKVN
jgi:Mg/Co/Ni transporter MgtE